MPVARGMRDESRKGGGPPAEGEYAPHLEGNVWSVIGGHGILDTGEPPGNPHYQMFV